MARRRGVVGLSFALAPARVLALVLALALATGPATAGSLIAGVCGQTPPLSAAQHDRLLRFAAVVRQVLDTESHGVALVARSGLDLSRFGVRYSHAGLALADGAGSRWAVRQLYYDCDAAQPQLYDQGLAGFVAGLHAPDRGFVSLLLPPPDAARRLRSAALDRPRALRLLAARYSANAHAWSLQYQNCNQWLAELMATAEGALPDGDDLRARAQAWLRTAGYVPASVDAGSHAVMFAAGFVPWVRLDDRPEDQRHSLVFQLSLPRSLEAFALARWPGTRRVTLCFAEDRVVLRRDGRPLPEDCVPEPGDEVRAL